MQLQTSWAPPEDEPNELARFRQEWLAELRSRKTVAGTPGTATAQNDPGIDAQDHNSSKAVFQSAVTYTRGLHKINGSSPRADDGASTTYTASVHLATNTLPVTLESALNIYRKAVQKEQSGDLDDALSLYRQAFRMDAHVDSVYYREEALAAIAAVQQDPLHTSTDSDTLVEGLTAKIQTSLIVKPTLRATTQALSILLAGFPANISFEPENEEEPVHLQKVPDELVVMFLRKLDTTSIERFASVSRKARIIALDSGIWRELVGATYNPPQVADVTELTAVLERCLYDYRRVYIEHPRVRIDGVYIATCHYIRPGLSENPWSNMNHLITYHRYLRFFSNGQVLSLLTNEEKSPQEVIPILKPTLRMQGLQVGTWHLTDTTIQLSNLLDGSGRFPLPTDDPHTVHHSPIVESSRYTFVMTLGLVSKPTGRWNKMHIVAYNSVHLESGDVHPVALKHERPYWFSKVRSYSAF
ncbi:hypothetical protein H0H87_012586 [Tephrocybe sp. NHM501043]|nr:hypothetical protein H0H87_012586 [Tephrocybe sp. NHM501043]